MPTILRPTTRTVRARTTSTPATTPSSSGEICTLVSGVTAMRLPGSGEMTVADCVAASGSGRHLYAHGESGTKRDPFRFRILQLIVIEPRLRPITQKATQPNSSIDMVPGSGIVTALKVSPQRISS